MEMICLSITHQSEKKKIVSWGSPCDIVSLKEGGKEKKKWNCLWLKVRGGFLTWKVCVRKDALNGGLHFGFQMCGLSCCLSLRWSVYSFSCLRESECSHAALQTRISVDRPQPESTGTLQSGATKGFSQTEQLTKRRDFLMCGHTLDLYLLLKQVYKLCIVSFSIVLRSSPCNFNHSWAICLKLHMCLKT